MNAQKLPFDGLEFYSTFFQEKVEENNKFC